MKDLSHGYWKGMVIKMRKTSIYKLFAILLVMCSILNPLQVFAAGDTSSATGVVNNTTGPLITSTYTVMNQIATVNLSIESDQPIKKLTYVQGELSSASSGEWSSRGVDITGKTSFEVYISDTYSILAEDTLGNKSVTYVEVDMEFRAVWISYLEFSSTGYESAEKFTAQIQEMFQNVVDLKMNAVVVQVRPFSDAMYKSSYFPWSKYASGKQGVDPGFDPMEIMVRIAHELGLEFHAWINPYRVTSSSTNVNTLSKKNPARKWLTDNDTSNDRNVISYGGKLYYNPASSQVRSLIVKGVKEIVMNYNVDGIHFDDYFYPTLGTNYAKVFDAQEYQEYKAEKIASGATQILSIADWRRNNVNTLIKYVYMAVHNYSDAIFGVSPGGYYDKLMMDDRYYVDVKTWLSGNNYVDYICPQLYWSFEHSLYPFDEALEAWMELRTSTTVKIYVGIPVYKAGSKEEAEFKTNSKILRQMVQTGKNSGAVDGYIFYRYAYFYNSTTKKAVNSLLNYLGLFY